MTLKERAQLERILAQPGEYESSDTFRSWLLAQFDAQTCTLEDFTLYFLHTLRHITQRHLKRAKIEDEEKPATAASNGNWKKSANVKRLTLTGGGGNQSSPHEASSYRSCLESTNFDSTLSSSTPVRRHTSQPVANGNSLTPVRRVTPHQQAQRPFTCSTPVNSGRVPRQDTSLSLSDFISFPSTPTGPNGNGSNRRRRQNQSKSNTNNSSSNGDKATGNSTGPMKSGRVTPVSQRFATPSPPSSSSESRSSFACEKNSKTACDDHEIGFNVPTKAMERRMLNSSITGNAPEVAGATAADGLIKVTNVSRIDNLDDGRILIGSIQPVDIANVVHKAALVHISQIYACLCDLDLVPNVLREVGYVLKLLNGQFNEPSKDEEADTEDSPLALLADFPNCIFFARDMLIRQQTLVLALDSQSLSAVLNNDRFDLLPKDFKYKLELCHQQKCALSKRLTIAPSSEGNFNNVYYRPEENTREMFDNETIFWAFKKQRDLFYNIFKEWESSNHVFSRDFKFKHRLTSIVREIFEVSRHTLNMLHLAQLFIAQLLIQQPAGVDTKKQKLLEQRFFAPGEYCMDLDYCFPDQQIFFRDFICECDCQPFLEQLKMVLFDELMRMNAGTFPQLQSNCNGAASRSVDRLDREDLQQLVAANGAAYVASPDILKSMLILAKFLGFVKALSYGGNNVDQILVQSNGASQQLRLRSLLQPDFDLYETVKGDFGAGKLLITLPWLIQYLAMLDNITLQLEVYAPTLDLLFEIYKHLGTQRPSLPSVVAFILRCCIGWLIELKPVIASRYYRYRRADIEQSAKAQMEQRRVVEHAIAVLELPNANEEQPQLEQLLTVVCPFLPEFRVTIMPVKHTFAKCPSRTGLFRHRTVELAKQDANPLSPSQQQQRIADAFLHSQGSSMRNFFDVVTERTFKSVIKDTKIEILQPSKFAANRKVSALNERCDAKLFAAIEEIYNEAEREACRKWQQRVPEMIGERVTKAIDSLLPVSTSAVIKRTYYQLIKSKVTLQVQQWLNETVLETDYYRVNSETASALHVAPTGVSVSDLITDLLHWQHATALCPQYARGQAELDDFLARLLRSFEQHTLPVHHFEQFGTGLVRIAQNLTLALPETLIAAPSTMEVFCSNLLKIIESGQLDRNQSADPSPHFLDPLFGVPYILQLMSSPSPLAVKAFERLAISLVRNSILTVEAINTLLIPLLKEDWGHLALDNLAAAMRRIVEATSGAANPSADDGKERLMMEALSDILSDTAF